jgi:hypothetical protein
MVASVIRVGKKENAFGFFVAKPERKRKLGGSISKLANNNKFYHIEIA